MRAGKAYGPFTKVNNDGTGPGGYGGGTRMTQADVREVATARTMVASPPLAVHRPGSALTALGVGALLSTIFLVMGIAVSRGPFAAATPSAQTASSSAPPAPANPAPATATASSRAGEIVPEPSVSAPPEVQPGSSPGAAAGPVDSEPMRAARAELADALKKGDTKRATDTLKLVLALDVNALADAEVRQITLRLAQTVSLLPAPRPAEFFELLKGGGGPRGLDVLYELVANRGGSRAAEAAADALRDPAVVARGSAAFQIAWEFRQAETCEAKRPLLKRLAADGDSRAFGLLVIAKQRCRRGAKCCDFKGPDVDQTFETLKVRTAQPR